MENNLSGNGGDDVGRLLHVNDDYIVLVNSDNQNSYYHIFDLDTGDKDTYNLTWSYPKESILIGSTLYVQFYSNGTVNNISYDLSNLQSGSGNSNAFSAPYNSSFIISDTEFINPMLFISLFVFK